MVSCPIFTNLQYRVPNDVWAFTYVISDCFSFCNICPMYRHIHIFHSYYYTCTGIFVVMCAIPKANPLTLEQPHEQLLHLLYSPPWTTSPPIAKRQSGPKWTGQNILCTSALEVLPGPPCKGGPDGACVRVHVHLGSLDKVEGYFLRPISNLPKYIWAPFYGFRPPPQIGA